MTTTTPVKEPPKTGLIPARRETIPPFMSLQRDINRLFEEFHRGLDLWRPSAWEPAAGDFHARVEVKDNENEIIVTAELAGVDPKDVELTVAADALTIEGDKKEEKEERHKGYYRTERYYGFFHRHVPLPCEIDKDKVEATFKNGILKVVMAKSKECLKDTKKVEIKAE